MLFPKCDYSVTLRDDFDFNQRVLGQPGDFHTGTGGLMFAEESRVNLVDGSEIIHILDKNRRLDHIGLVISGFL